MNEVEHLVEIFAVDGPVLVDIAKALADVRDAVSVHIVNIAVFDITEVEDAVAVAILAFEFTLIGNKVVVAVGEDVALAVVQNPIVVAVQGWVFGDFSGVRCAVFVAVFKGSLVEEDLVPSVSKGRI